MPKPPLEPKSPREDAARREHQHAVKRSLIEFPAFGLTLLAARVRNPNAAETGFANYNLPDHPAELAFTLKGALRLEMMNSKNALWQKYRRLFGSNTKAKDLSAWRSRVYIEAFAMGAEAATAAQSMFIPQLSENATDFPAQADLFLTTTRSATGQVVLLQVNDVFLTADRQHLFSDLLRTFLERESRLLHHLAHIRVLPVWKEVTR